MNEINQNPIQNDSNKNAESGTDFGDAASGSEQLGGFGGACSTNKHIGGWRQAPCLQDTKEEKGTNRKEQGTEKNTKDKKPTEPRTNVRFTEEEFKKLEAESQRTGKSIPILLKTTYFKKEIKTSPFDKEDSKKILSALSRIGNNINQIARALNSGFREGFNKDIINANDELTLLRKYIGGAWQ